jgi:anti-anti-sigma regulatory factor
MLRITTHTSEESTTITVEGRLVGPWVRELERSWLSLIAGSAERNVSVDLAAVTFIDGDGEKLLTQMYRQGADLRAADCLMRAIVEDIAKRPRSSNLQ